MTTAVCTRYVLIPSFQAQVVQKVDIVWFVLLTLICLDSNLYGILFGRFYVLFLTIWSNLVSDI